MCFLLLVGGVHSWDVCVHWPVARQRCSVRSARVTVDGPYSPCIILPSRSLFFLFFFSPTFWNRERERGSKCSKTSSSWKEVEGRRRSFAFFTTRIADNLHCALFIALETYHSLVLKALQDFPALLNGITIGSARWHLKGEEKKNPSKPRPVKHTTRTYNNDAPTTRNISCSPPDVYFPFFFSLFLLEKTRRGVFAGNITSSPCPYNDSPRRKTCLKSFGPFFLLTKTWRKERWRKVLNLYKGISLYSCVPV